MKFRAVHKLFLDRLTLAGLTLETLTPASGIEMMLRFYEEERVDRCSLDDDGDLLQFQWGLYDWGEGERFELNISRQLMTNEVAGDEQIRQLALTFGFAPTPALAEAGDGDQWCDTPEGLDEFRQFITTSAGMQATTGHLPERVDLTWDEV
ncbi:MAG: hypothetical protein LC104_13830 [Bacteroidales bacterium]|nr:hypothetical protein [Bacteroidales bacterium]